jgi:hypothetical protein
VLVVLAVQLIGFNKYIYFCYLNWYKFLHKLKTMG